MQRLFVATTLRSDIAEFDLENRAIADALADRGLRPELRPWHTELEPWLTAGLVLVRTTWDYPDHLDDFDAWLDALAAADIPTINPVRFLRWNIRKRYLLDLAAAGVPIVPAEFIPAGTHVPASTIRRVLKPEVGVGGIGAEIIEAGDDATAQVDSLLNPYLPAVANGERSVFLVEGEPIVVVRKVPASDEFRVHRQYGGNYEIEADPSPAVLAAAHLAYEHAERIGADGDLNYLRVDLLERDPDEWLVLEVEGVEPSLYPALTPAVADALAAAVSRRFGAPGPLDQAD